METNKELVRRAYELFEAGRVAEARELFAPNAVWILPGRHTLSGEYLGRDAIFNDFLSKLPALTGATYRATAIDIAEGDDHTFVLQNSSALREGKTINYFICNVFALRDGLIQGVHSYPYDAEAQETFWG
jgi:ketosteroid isomerase-like protein